MRHNEFIIGLIDQVIIILNLLQDLGLCHNSDSRSIFYWLIFNSTFTFVFLIDNGHEIIKHLRVDIVKVYSKNILLLLVKDAHDTCGHLSYLLVDSHEVRVSKI